MKFLDRLLGRKEATPPEAEVAEPDCPHVALVPFWDSAEDIGVNEKIARYECESCKAAFTREQGEQIRVEGADRLRISEKERRDRLAE